MAELKNRRRRTASIVLAGALTVAGSGVAYAYWSANGTGVGTAVTGTSTAFTITTLPPAGPALTPGATIGQTVDFTVTNPGTGGQLLARVAARVANADGSEWTAVSGCSAADYSITVEDNPAPVEIVGGGTATGQIAILMNDLEANQDACQGVTVPIFFDVGEEL